MYFVIQKHQGQFDGSYGAYYGGYWIKVNYPNAFDAARANSEKLISSQQQETISKQWRQRAPTLENTRLGGGIGFHGWIKEWSNDGPRHLSWGCVVMHIYDISKVYDQIPEGSMVVIFLSNVPVQSRLTNERLVAATEALAARDHDLASIYRLHGPPPMWGRRPGFSTLLRIVLEQQVSLVSARACLNA